MNQPRCFSQLICHHRPWTLEGATLDHQFLGTEGELCSENGHQDRSRCNRRTIPKYPTIQSNEKHPEFLLKNSSNQQPFQSILAPNLHEFNFGSCHFHPQTIRPNRPGWRWSPHRVEIHQNGRLNIAEHPLLSLHHKKRSLHFINISLIVQNMFKHFTIQFFTSEIKDS